MQKVLILMATLAVSLAGIQTNSAQLDGQQTYDFLFKNGTLDEITPTETLVYIREVTNTLNPDAAKRGSGDITLSHAPDDPSMMSLQLHQGDKFRGLGEFPASVGNPMIMYFYESVVRDMAETAGGSPFYIRNRIKEALIRPNEAREGQGTYDGRTVATQTVRMRPFADDPNRDRMKGFGDLELVVTMSDEVPGWYLNLSATAGDVYHSDLQFDEVEAGK